MDDSLAQRLHSAKRIHIIGGPGTGKSMLARRLGSALKLPVYSLDDVAYEGPEFEDRPLESRTASARAIAALPRWVSEGIFVGWTDPLLEQADLIIWLDWSSWRSAAPRIALRWFRDALGEVKIRRGRGRFLRFRDYARNTRQLLFVLTASREYWGARGELHRYPVTRALTTKVLSPFQSKVVHVTHTRESTRLGVLARGANEALELGSAEPPIGMRSRYVRPLTVDIVVNNYNYGRYIRQAIDSALQQTYSRVTVIAVDDGSTDDSRDVIESYGSKIVSIFKENGGQGSAFNAGFKAGRGDVVVFLDADDALLPGVAAQVIGSFSEDERLSKVQYRMEVIDDGGRPIGVVKPPPHLPMRSGDLRRQELLFPFDLTWMATSGNAFARWALERIFPIPEDEFRILADWYVVHLTPLLGRVRSLPDVGAHHRIHGANWFEPASLTIDLNHIRTAIVHAERMRTHLRRYAGNLDGKTKDVAALSISDLAIRLVSLKMAPGAHPIKGDTQFNLLLMGLRAARRRFDAAWRMRILFMLWFGVAALTPRALLPRVAEPFFFPERRPRLNRLLASAHRDG